MTRVKFAIIADDNTGATDAAGMLTAKGVKTCLINEYSSIDNYDYISEFDAVVLGTQSRSVEPEKAYEITINALQFLDRFSPDIIQIKYCSTFDSTPKGNIGKFLDAAKDYSRQASIVVCPALPVNGRTTYMGYHFVNGELLSESPLKDHPLNPMTDAYLPRWLSYQTKRKTGLVSMEDINQGVEAVRKKIQYLEQNDISYWIADAIAQEDIFTVVNAIKNQRIISGGSGITAEIPDLLFDQREMLDFSNKIRKLNPGMLVISGSMSPVTRQQNMQAIETGNFEGMQIDPVAILKGNFDLSEFSNQVASKISLGKNVIVYSPYESKAEVFKWIADSGITEVDAGIKIGRVLAHIAGETTQRCSPGKLVVAGGETSGEICKKLNINEMEVGLPVDPGVPYCFPKGKNNFLLVLKSGNFGSNDLYTKVLNL